MSEIMSANRKNAIMPNTTSKNPKILLKYQRNKSSGTNMTDEERLSAIDETIKKIKDPETGLGSLETIITNALTPELKLIDKANQHILNTTGQKEKKEDEPFKYLKAFIWCVLFKKIQENEESHAKTPSEFKETIGDEIKEIVKAIPKLSKKELETTLDNYDDKREKLNGTPARFMKYGFTTSCTNGAVAFIDEFTKGHPERKKYVKFMFTTVWDHLLDGSSGHTVPCVKLNNGDWVIIEPRINTIPKGTFTKIISKDDFEVGKPFKHLMTYRNGEPYMITAILDEPYTDHEEFLNKASCVPLDKAQTFIEQIHDQKYITQEQYQQQQKTFTAERDRRKQSLRSATEKVEQLAQSSPNVSAAELKKAQEQQAFFDY